MSDLRSKPWWTRTLFHLLDRLCIIKCIYFLSTVLLALEQWPSRRRHTSNEVPKTVSASLVKSLCGSFATRTPRDNPQFPLHLICEFLAMNQLTTQRKEISREEDATSVRQAQTRNLQESRQSMAVFFVMSAYVVMGVTTFTTAATNR